METLDIILVVIGLSAIAVTAIYMLKQKKVEKSSGEGPVLRPQDDVEQPPTGSSN